MKISCPIGFRVLRSSALILCTVLCFSCQREDDTAGNLSPNSKIQLRTLNAKEIQANPKLKQMISHFEDAEFNIVASYAKEIVYAGETSYTFKLQPKNRVRKTADCLMWC